MGYKQTKDFPGGMPPVDGFEGKDPEPPDHITPGGPDPVKKVDIVVDEDNGTAIDKDPAPVKSNRKLTKAI